MRSPRQLNYPPLAVPDAPETKIFAAVRQVLRTDPRLTAAVNLFLCWEGSEGDTWAPTSATCPFLRISPFPASDAWATEKQHSSPLVVHVEIATVGTRWDDACNLWGLVRAAIFPQDDTDRRDEVIALLQNAGATRPTITLSGFGIEQGDDANSMIVARGTIEFGALVGT